jgi:hypothetical protein
MERGLGYIPSEEDPKDYKVLGDENSLFGVSTSIVSPAEHLELLTYVDFVRDQGGTQSCVWQAIQQQHYVALGANGVSSRKALSVLFGYWQTRKKLGLESLDMGCMPRLAWKAAQDMGFCPDDLWPFDEPEVNRPPSLDATAGAIDQKWIDGYYSIWGVTNRIEEVKLALSQNHPVVFGTGVDRAFKSFRSDEDKLLHTPAGEIVGRHMMCALAYDAEGLWVVNSWGKDWGVPDPSGIFRGGFFHMAWDWVEWIGCTDWWAVKYAPVLP